MSNLPISSPYRSQPEAPVTEAERDQLSARLNQAFTDGTMDPDDYHTRLDRLFAARKLGELVPVVDGLPQAQSYAEPANITSGGTPGQVSEARAGGTLTLALMVALAVIVALIAIVLVWAL